MGGGCRNLPGCTLLPSFLYLCMHCTSIPLYLSIMRNQCSKEMFKQAHLMLDWPQNLNLLIVGDTTIGIATGSSLDDQLVGVQVLVELRTLSFQCHLHQLWGPHILLSNAYWELPPLPKIKLLGCQADRSPPNTAEAKKTWIYISIPPRLHGVVLN
jgi:hypothetical protein